MKKAIIVSIFTVLIMLLTTIPSLAAVEIEAQTGWDIFESRAGALSLGYRYGPSIIINEDGSIDMWTASTCKNAIAADWIMYRHSKDNGATWTEDVPVVKPNAGSEDALSNCDPGVIKIGSYYYVGYTSSVTLAGSDDLYIARSLKPEGPYEKWNGNGWGGDPKPILDFDGDESQFGIGEPSFVELNGVLYIYYTYISTDVKGNGITQTRVATADANSITWPATIKERGVSFSRSIAEDSADVKYIEGYGKFIAVAGSKRLNPNSYINMYESIDGLKFTPATLKKNNIMKFMHNVGISSRSNGHINLSDNNFISYAYGATWGVWKTYLQPIIIMNDNLPAEPEVFNLLAENSKVTLYFENIPGVKYKIIYGINSQNLNNVVDNINTSPFTVTGLQNDTTYYFKVYSYTSLGESHTYTIGSATPRSYSKINFTSVTAKSQSDNIAKLTDGNITTTWSSDVLVEDSDEWVKMYTNSVKVVKRVIVTPSTEGFFPWSGIKISVSHDGNTWYEPDINGAFWDGLVSSDEGQITLTKRNNDYIYEFNKPISAKYVKLYMPKLCTDISKKYCVKFSEITVDCLPGNTTVDTSNYITGLDVSSSHHQSGFALRYNNAYVKPGTPFNVIVKARYKNGQVLDVSSQATYSEYDSKICSINSSGVGTVYNYGMTLIKVNFQGKTSYVNVMSIADSPIVSFSAEASSEFNVPPYYFPARYALDGDINGNIWISETCTNQNTIQWLKVNMGNVGTVNGIKIIPRQAVLGSNGSAVGFPVDFVLQYSIDGQNWTDIPGQNYINYNTGGIGEQSFIFGSGVKAQYIRLYATKLGRDINDSPNYYSCEVADLIINPKSATASSEFYIPPYYFPARYVLDNDIVGNIWISESFGSPNTVQWLNVDTGSIQMIDRVRVAPRQSVLASSGSAVGFPVSFKFQYSSDNQVWTDVPGQNYTNYNTNGIGMQNFIFSKPVMGKYLRLYSTELGRDVNDNPNYYSCEIASIWINEIHPTNITPNALKMIVASAASSYPFRITAQKSDWSEIDVTNENETTYSIENSNIISIDKNNASIIPLQAGTTRVNVNYKGLTTTFMVQVNAFIWDSSASTTYGDYYARLARDGNKYTMWTSNIYYDTGDRDEWIAIKSETSRQISGVFFQPRAYGVGSMYYPKNFKIQYKTDLLNWDDVPGQTYTNYEILDHEQKNFVFGQPINTKGVRLFATKIGEGAGSAANTYGMQFMEFGILDTEDIPIESFTSEKSVYIAYKDSTDSKQIRTIVKFTDGTEKYPVSQFEGVSYTGYDSNIVSISQTGKVTVINNGQTAVTATYKGLSTTFVIIAKNRAKHDIARIQMNDGAGNAVADISDNNNNGNIVGNVNWWQAGKIGYCLYFDGNTYVNIPDSQSMDTIDDELSIDLWVYNTSAGGYIRLVDKISAGGSDGFLLDLTPGNGARFIVGSQIISTSDNTIPINQWTHIKATYKTGDKICIYINGVLSIENAAQSRYVPDNNLPIRLGADQEGSSIFSGYMDEVNIKESISNDVGRYSFEETIGGEVNDITGNMNNGSITGNINWWQAGKIGYCLQFDGNTYVNIPNSQSLDSIDDELSIDLWVYNTSSGSYRRLVDKISAGGSDGFLLDLTPGNGVRFIVGSQIITTPDNTVPINQWTRIKVTYSASGKIRIYMNEALVSEDNALNDYIIDNSLPLRIGAAQDGSSMFTGLIDEVILEKRVH